MFVTPRLTVAEVLRTDPAMAQALGVNEGQAQERAQRVERAARSDDDFRRGAARQADQIADRTAERLPGPDEILERRAAFAPPPAPAPAGQASRQPAFTPGIDSPIDPATDPAQGNPVPAQPRAESRALSDADRYRQAQAARAISVYEANQLADRRRPGGSSAVDGRV